MSPTAFLHTVYLCIIAGIVILGVVILGLVHHDGVNDGMKECQKSAQKAMDDQRVKDAEATQDVIDGLNADKRALQQQLAARPAPRIVYSCARVQHADQVPAPASPARAKPGELAVSTVDSSLPAGSGERDVGPGVRALAAAGATLAIYRQRLYDWAVSTR